MIEKIIAYNCGPALAGIKPSNIVACYKNQIPNVVKEIDRLNYELNKKDIYIEIMCECEKRVLVMVYRKDKLTHQLNNSEIIDFLKSFGYPVSGNINDLLEFLKIRLKENEFPHEIGVFLGYPLHDIYGFINHKDEGCLLTGEWKVYKDPEKAERLFCRYRTCREAILKRISEGKTLAQLFCAA